MSKTNNKIYFDKIRKPIAPPTKAFKSIRDYDRSANRNYLSDSSYYDIDEDDVEEGDDDGEG